MAKKNTVEIILAAKDKASKATQQAFGTVQSSAKAAFGAVRAASLAAAGAIATVSGVVGKLGIDHNAMMEQSSVAWTTLLGTTEKAQDMLKQISDFTKATPFETAEVDMMAKYMHNAGLEGQKLFDELMRVSDVASAFAIPASEAKEMTRQMSQVRQAGVAYTEDLNILQDRGVPIFKAIAEQQGIMVKDVKKMASEGKLSSDIYVDAFNSIAKGVEGASDAQSKTFLGMISTLKDNVSIFAGQVMEPAFNRLKDLMPIVISAVENLSDAFSKGGWKGVMSELLPPDVVNFITSSMSTIKDVFNQVKDSLLENKGRIIGVFQGIGETTSTVFNTLKSIAIPIIETVVAFVSEKLASLKQFWDENGTQILEAVRNVFNGIKAVIDFIMPAVLFIIQMVWSNIKGVISGALDVIMGVIKVFSGLFTGDFSKMWEGIKQLFLGAIEFVWNLINLMMFGRILGGIKAFITKGISSFSGFWTKTVEIFKNLDTQAWNIITGFVSKIVGKLKGFYDEGARIFGTLRTYGANMFQSLWSAISTVASNIYSAVIGRFTSMVSGAKFQFQGMWKAATDIFGKIKSAITNPITTAKNTIVNMIDKIKSAFRNMGVKIPLPHFSVSNFSLNPKDWVTKGLPKLSVDWYDKGGVFYGPQIIGVGEKRPEFVGALDDLEDIVRNVVRSEGGTGDTNGLIQAIKALASRPIQVIVDGYELMMAIYPYLDEKQQSEFSTAYGMLGVKG